MARLTTHHDQMGYRLTPPVPAANVVGMRTLSPKANALVEKVVLVGAAGAGVQDGSELPVGGLGLHTICPTYEPGARRVSCVRS